MKRNAMAYTVINLPLRCVHTQTQTSRRQGGRAPTRE